MFCSWLLHLPFFFLGAAVVKIVACIIQYYLPLIKDNLGAAGIDLAPDLKHFLMCDAFPPFSSSSSSVVINNLLYFCCSPRALLGHPPFNCLFMIALPFFLPLFVNRFNCITMAWLNHHQVVFASVSGAGRGRRRVVGATQGHYSRSLLPIPRYRECLSGGYYHCYSFLSEIEFVRFEECRNKCAFTFCRLFLNLFLSLFPS